MEITKAKRNYKAKVEQLLTKNKGKEAWHELKQWSA